MAPSSLRLRTVNTQISDVWTITRRHIVRDSTVSFLFFLLFNLGLNFEALANAASRSFGDDDRELEIFQEFLLREEKKKKKKKKQAETKRKQLLRHPVYIYDISAIIYPPSRSILYTYLYTSIPTK